MAVNRLPQFDSDPNPAAEQPAQPPEMTGFEAVPLSGMPGWEQADPGALTIYEFAWFLTQILDPNDPTALRRWLN